MLKVRFFYHSCFSVETDKHILVFDYYDPQSFERGSVTDKKPCFEGDKELIFFNSHRHIDHFSENVLDYDDGARKVSFVLSDDIRFKEKDASKHEVTFVSPNKSYEIGEIKVETLLSTDEGVAFIVTCDGKCIYHAGDLHWWYWSEKGAEYVKHWGEKYFNEIDKIRDRHFDLSFVVVDSRMTDGYEMGLLEFLRRVPDSNAVIPMHMWGRYELIREIKAGDGAAYADRIYDIEKEGQEFIPE